MNIYDPTFSSAQVAAAAGMSAANFRAQFQRGNWRFIGKPAEANGFGHLFSIYDALGFALARELMERGINAKSAFDRAMSWAHGGASMAEEPEAISVFVLGVGLPGEVKALPVAGGLAFVDMFSSAFAPAPTLVNLTALDRRVREALDIQP